MNEHIGPELQALLYHIEERNAEAGRRNIKSWLLASDIATYMALQRGEAVPLSSLNPDAVVLYGLKKHDDDDRPERNGIGRAP